MKYRIGTLVKLNDPDLGRLNGRIARVVLPSVYERRTVAVENPLVRREDHNGKLQRIVHSHATSEYQELLKLRLTSNGTNLTLDAEKVTPFTGRLR